MAKIFRAILRQKYKAMKTSLLAINRLTKVNFNRIRKYIAYEIGFHYQLEFGVFFLRLFGDQQKCDRLQKEIETCAPGTVGYHLNKTMKAHQITFVPWYERHDLKHILLGYQMTAPEEMKMQAFMFGNAGFPPFITIAALSFMIWTPSVWKTFAYHFKVGMYTRPLYTYKIETSIHQNLQKIQQELGLAKAKQFAKADKHTWYQLLRNRKKIRRSNS